MKEKDMIPENESFKICYLPYPSQAREIGNTIITKEFSLLMLTW